MQGFLTTEKTAYSSLFSGKGRSEQTMCVSLQRGVDTPCEIATKPQQGRNRRLKTVAPYETTQQGVVTPWNAKEV